MTVFHQLAPYLAVEAVQIFFTQRCWLPAGDGGAAVVYREMLPRPQQHLNDRECHRRAQGAPQWLQTVGGGRLQCQTDIDGEIPEGRGCHSIYGNDGAGRYVDSLPPAPALMVLGREDMDHDL